LGYQGVDKDSWLLHMIAKKGIDLFLRLLQVGGLEQLAQQLQQIFVCEALKAGSGNWALN